MTNFLLALTVFLTLFIVFFASVMTGYRFGVFRKTKSQQNHLEIVRVAEGTVFALFGLLVAFSFSGSYSRFEDRKVKIIAEVNAIENAYQYTELLEPASRVVMRDLIRQYIDFRIAAYQQFAEFTGFEQQMDRFNKMENVVRHNAMQAIIKTNNNSASLLFAPAISDMLEIANTRILITRIHPAGQIFFLLIGLGALSAFLLGINMAKKQKFSTVDVLCFVAITAYTLYVIIDMEYPRVGMIRVNTFDNFLVETKDRLSQDQ